MLVAVSQAKHAGLGLFDLAVCCDVREYGIDLALGQAVALSDSRAQEHSSVFRQQIDRKQEGELATKHSVEDPRRGRFLSRCKQPAHHNVRVDDGDGGRHRFR
jgi:hypothetical protein